MIANSTMSKYRRSKQLQDCGHYDITVIENEVLVTEWNNKGQITVYDRDLNFVHHIFINDKITLRHMNPDNHGNLYISNDTVLDFFFFLRNEGGGGVGGVLFKPWKSFPAANNGGPMMVKQSDQ